jgi:hypothetical protein
VLWEQQDERLRQLYPVPRPRIQQSYNKLELSDGGVLLALPGKDPDVIRSHHPTVLVMDEAAYIEQGGEAFDVALASRVPWVRLISTAAPSWIRASLKCSTISVPCWLRWASRYRLEWHRPQVLWRRPSSKSGIVSKGTQPCVKWESQAELLAAAQKSVCRNTGWPIGVVLTNPELSPKPMSDGIRAVIRSTIFRNSFDFWSLDSRGYFYLLRELEEDSDTRIKAATSLYFDTRIWRIAEGLLHCANLYWALNVPAETEIRIQMVHRGLEGRRLLASDQLRALTMSGRISHENESRWTKTVPLGTIEPNFETLVGEISGELFMLFEFWQPQPEVWKGILQAFLSSRI